MKRALITGSSGLVGRHMVTELTARGDWDIMCLDRKISESQDARRFFATDHSFFDLVVHCAAHVGGRQCIENQAAYIGAYNAQLDGSLFEWALRSRPAHVMYWSSSAAYPVILQTGYSPVRLHEEHISIEQPDRADQTYGWVKLIGERLAVEAAAEGLRVHVFRPFSGWAGDQDTSYPMGAFLDRAWRRADPFHIWGSGAQVRDFIHMRDVIGASLAAVEQDYPGPLNLCTGRATAFAELAVTVAKLAGYNPVFEFLLDKPAGVMYRVGDPTEMNKVWPACRELEDAITRALAGGR